MHYKNTNLIVAISGASGAIYGIRLLEILKNLSITTHLVISQSAFITIRSETNYTINKIKSIANYCYNNNDISARIASGSCKINGMIIAPCSMKTTSGIAHGFEDNLIIRAASVILKERKPLILMLRETPLHSIYLENMLTISRAGGIISPIVPAFYNKPKNIDDLIKHSITRVLDLLNIDTQLIKRWDGLVI